MHLTRLKHKSPFRKTTGGIELMIPEPINTIPWSDNSNSLPD